MTVILSASTISSPPKGHCGGPAPPTLAQLASSVLFWDRRSQGFSSDGFGSWPTSTPQHSHTQGSHVQTGTYMDICTKTHPLTDFMCAHKCKTQQGHVQAQSFQVHMHVLHRQKAGVAGTREMVWKGKGHAFSYLPPLSVKCCMSRKVQIKCHLPHEGLPDFPPEHQVLPPVLSPGSLSST